MIARLTPLLLVALLSGSCRESTEKTGSSNPSETQNRGRSSRDEGATESVTALARSEFDEGLPVRIAKLRKEEVIELVKLSEADRYVPGKGHIFNFAIAELAKRDADLALSFFEPGSIKARDPGLVGVFPEIAQSNPEALKRWLKEKLISAPPAIQAQTLGFALASMSKIDAKEAFEFFNSNTWNGVAKGDVLRPVFYEFGLQSADEAVAASQANLKGNDADAALLQIASGASVGDPAKGLEVAKKIARSDARAVALAQVMMNWLGHDRDQAIAHLKSLEPQDIQLLLRHDARVNSAIMGDLGKDNPDALFALLRNVIPTKANEDVLLAAVSSTALASPQQLSELLGSFPEGPLKDSLVQKQYMLLAGSDLAAALKSAESLNENARISAYKAIGGAADLGKLFSISGQIPRKAQEAIWSTAMPKLAQMEPAQASQLLNDPRVVIPDSERGPIVESIGYQLNDVDKAKSDEWYGQLSEADKISAIKGIARNLAAKDLVSLSDKLGSMPHDKAWAAGVGVLIDNIKESDPEVAEEWRQALKGAGFK